MENISFSWKKQTKVLPASVAFWEKDNSHNLEKLAQVLNYILPKVIPCERNLVCTRNPQKNELSYKAEIDRYAKELLLWVIHRTVVKTGLEFPSFLTRLSSVLCYMSIFATVWSRYILSSAMGMILKLQLCNLSVKTLPWACFLKFT